MTESGTPRAIVVDLLRGRLSSDELQQLQRQTKDLNRQQQVIEIEQERLGWDERIILPLQEHLFVVEDPSTDGPSVRCDCGYWFGDYQRNWKESALVYERDPLDEEVYLGPRAADPEWHVLREFYCPGCATQLDVEAVPQGYPFIFNFLPQLPTAELES
jgi:acetone carboxylase gamma subunit